MIKRKVFAVETIFAPSSFIYRRCLHQHVKAERIPKPTPFVPDHTTFLSLIGRELSKHASKFTKWDELFTLSSQALKEMGIEPVRKRRYLLHWREKFRKGEFGLGGDLKYVQDGVGELRVVEIPSLRKPPSDKEAGESKKGSSAAAKVSATVAPGMTKLIVNVPAGYPTYKLEKGQSTKDLRKVKGVKLHEGYAIKGPFIELKEGSNGTVGFLWAQEGLWEHRRGHKVDGGERRKAEVRFKRRVEERKKERG